MHPENPGRIRAIHDELQRRHMLAGRPEVRFTEASHEEILRVHDAAYVEGLERLALAGGGALDPDTLVLSDSLSVARLATGAAVAATRAVLSGEVDHAFCLGRPPGHHATPARGMGFCLLNTIAIAATEALAQGLDRIVIIDWDVHHGNGTQDAFYATDQVLYCSLHQSPLYPGTGSKNETGIGAGSGFTLNVPVPPGNGDDVYIRLFEEVMVPRIRQYQPQLVLVSAGFDAHAADPLANMRVTEQGFAMLAQRVTDLADAFARGRLVSILEGGYDPQGLGRSVAAVLDVFDTGVRSESGPTDDKPAATANPGRGKG